MRGGGGWGWGEKKKKKTEREREGGGGGGEGRGGKIERRKRRKIIEEKQVLRLFLLASVNILNNFPTCPMPRVAENCSAGPRHPTDLFIEFLR